LGLEATMEDGLIKVVSPIANAPASRAGILSGDIITRIDGEVVQGLSLERTIDKMRGTANTSVKLTIMRKDSEKPLEFKITRELIQVRNVRFRKEGDVGYIQITQFGEHTARDVRAAIVALKKDIGEDKLKGFVLDLRDDPGGLVDQAVGVGE